MALISEADGGRRSRWPKERGKEGESRCYDIGFEREEPSTSAMSDGDGRVGTNEGRARNEGGGEQSRKVDEGVWLW